MINHDFLLGLSPFDRKWIPVTTEIHQNAWFGGKNKGEGRAAFAKGHFLLITVLSQTNKQMHSVLGLSLDFFFFWIIKVWRIQKEGSRRHNNERHSHLAFERAWWELRVCEKHTRAAWSICLRAQTGLEKQLCGNQSNAIWIAGHSPFNWIQLFLCVPFFSPTVNKSLILCFHLIFFFFSKPLCMSRHSWALSIHTRGG